MAINVRYVYSACVVVTTQDLKILCDPWFTEGAFDGSWFHFPKVTDPLGSIGDVDKIYVSHIHPDHYDHIFLKSYLDRYGEKDLLIPDHSPNFLQKKMIADGFTPTIVGEDERLELGNTTIQIMPHKTGSISDVDSALIVEAIDATNRRHCIVNANDIIFDENARRQLKKRGKDVDIFLCGYTGAGPYPQTYFDIDDPQLLVEAGKKKNGFLDRYKSRVNYINAKVNIPFAGKYVLGGKLAGLNPFRGVADPVEVLEFDENAVVLADNRGEISTEDLVATGTRIEPYSEISMRERMDEIKNGLMDYERLIDENEIYQLPIKRLIGIAYRKAVALSEVDSDYYFAFYVNGEYIIINAKKGSQPYPQVATRIDELPSPRSIVSMDERYLFGLLTNIYHWNNGEIGSHYTVRREPQEFNRKAQQFLNFLAV